MNPPFAGAAAVASGGVEWSGVVVCTPIFRGGRFVLCPLSNSVCRCDHRSGDRFFSYTGIVDIGIHDEFTPTFG